MSQPKYKVLVLGGGPDLEREVSLKSAAGVAEALRAAGHETIERDILPKDLSALDEACDVIFPVLHGRWGEGGPLQKKLEACGKPFVGWGSAAATLAMNKAETKRVAEKIGIETPESVVVTPGETPEMEPPVVVKPVDDGSSMGVTICEDDMAVSIALENLLSERGEALVERFIEGREMTVGILDDATLPVIEIVPHNDFYDYEAKYDRNDTEYRFEIDADPALLLKIQTHALGLHYKLGGRHLSRVDFIVDEAGHDWLLEINTLPGFTSHSLLPQAARQTGLEMDALCDRLVSLALRDGVSR